MSREVFRRTCRRSLVVCALALSPALEAQDPPFNASLVGRFAEAGANYADVWGEGTFAILARNEGEVDVIDLGDPAMPVLISNYSLPGPDSANDSQDGKIADGLLFIAIDRLLSMDGVNGASILDFRDPSNVGFLSDVTVGPGNYAAIHNVFYDGGWLYLANAYDNTVAIVDLRTYDPDNPPALISGWDYQLTNVGGAFVHDITVQGGRLYCAAWDSLVVYDVSNLATQAPSFLGCVGGVNVHSVWATDDGAFVFTAEERPGGGLRLYEVEDLGSSIQLHPYDSFVAASSSSTSMHNPLVVADRIYTAFYEAGGLVFELDRGNKTIELVASYDTSSQTPQGFFGDWGVYPFLGEDKVLLSDKEEGLFVVDFSAVQIEFPLGRPEIAQPFAAETITVELAEIGNSSVDAGSVLLHYSVDGAATVTVPMTNVTGAQYEAALPGVGCGGAIDYYVTADDLSGRSFADPADAPATQHTVHVATGVTDLFFDDFETDLGWSITNQNLTGGAWTLADPNGSGGQPEDDDPRGQGTQCYVTGQGSVGGLPTEADVDGGPTTLTSPLFDLSGGDALIHFTSWFFNDTVDDDALVVEITNGGAWVQVKSTSEKAGGWVDTVFRVADFVSPSATVQVRFQVSDDPNDSITEAGLDSFRVQSLACQPAAFTLSRNGTGCNPVGYVALNDPELGSTWTATVDIATPGAALSVVGIVDSGPFGAKLAIGEVLIDVSAPFLGGLDVQTGNHAFAVPGDLTLLGQTYYTQAATFSPGDVRLQNAIDTTFGY